MTRLTMIPIRLNGADEEVPEGSTAFDLLARHGAEGPGIAVAVNDAVIRGQDLARVTLSAGDRVEIIRAVGGG